MRALLTPVDYIDQIRTRLFLARREELQQRLEYLRALMDSFGRRSVFSIGSTQQPRQSRGRCPDDVTRIIGRRIGARSSMAISLREKKMRQQVSEHPRLDGIVVVNNSIHFGL